jgi:hypothetical protein
MNEAKISDRTITFTDPETGEEHTLPASDLRIMVAGIAKDVPELGEIPPELRQLFADDAHTITLEAQDVQINPDVIEALALKDAGIKVSQMEADTARERAALTSEQSATPRAMVKPNRKQRRANEKANRRSSKAQAKHRDSILKQMQRRFDAERKAREEQEALQDVPFADPRHIGKIVRVFEPIEKALQNFVDGEVATMDDGTTLLWATEDGCWYPAVNCLRSVLETYAKLGETYGWANHNAGLARVATLLENGEPIHKADVDAALKTVEWMKYCTLTITPNQFTKEAVEVQIANELRDEGLAPEPTDTDLTRDGV